MKLYMHLIHGRPGYYDGKQIVSDSKIRTNQMCKTLYELKIEQKKSAKWRVLQGWGVPDYHYVKIYL